jgi:hypothetical protein
VRVCDSGGIEFQEGGFRRGLFVLRGRLREYAEAKCDRGYILESDNVLDVLRGGYTAMAYANGAPRPHAPGLWWCSICVLVGLGAVTPCP